MSKPTSDKPPNGKATPPAAREPERQEMLAMMLATGRFTTKQITQLLGFSAAAIRTMRKSPIFVQLIKKYQETVYHSVVDQALAELLADTPDNVEWLKGVRDGEIVDEPSALAVRTRAASALFDRQIPKRQQEDSSGGVKIVINADLKDRFDAADRELEEFGAIEVEAEEVGE